MDYYSNYLNLPAIIINEVIGSLWLTIFILLILITWLCVKSNVSGQLTVMLNIAAILVLVSFDTGLTILYVLTVLFVGGVGYYIVAKLMNR